jgi:hypothetical protein
MQNNTESITKQFENAVELTNLTEAQLEIVKQILINKFNK